MGNLPNTARDGYVHGSSLHTLLNRDISRYPTGVEGNANIKTFMKILDIIGYKLNIAQLESVVCN
jgi:hypothetical protein